MAFLRRIWNRDDGNALAACTALDIGTEFAKALVFEIDEDGHGTVRGVGRKRQGLSHMQSGTVADINAVVDNCAVALQEAEEMAGFRPNQVVIGMSFGVTPAGSESAALCRRSVTSCRAR